MAWDIVTGRARVGLVDSDDTRDAQITPAMALALALGERHCNRIFSYGTDVQRFSYPGNRVYLRRYPVETVTKISLDKDGNNLIGGTWSVDEEIGQVELKSMSALPSVYVHYTGGYSAMPIELEEALWEIFGAIWDERYGESADDGGLAAATDGGAIKQITLFGVGSIAFDAAPAPTATPGATATMFVNPATRLAWILDSFRRIEV